MNSFPSAKIIPSIYLMTGLIFLFFPELPYEILGFEESHPIASLSLNREIGVLFIALAIIIRKIHTLSKSVYRLMNSTFIVVMLILALTGPMFYFLMPSHPYQFILISVINFSFVLIFYWERKQ